jgi:1,2-diacylglycerol 3-beta-galactosyltransferase
VTIITDLGSVHTLWYYRFAAACLVATEKVRQQAIGYGLPPERVHVCGIPISPAFSKETRRKEILRTELGWRIDLPTALAVGSVRVPHMAETLRQLNSSDVPIQLALVAGGDVGLLEELRGIEWRLPVHIYDWVDDMPTLLHASDFVISKAGGLIIAESLACGLPLLLVDVMPDQEKGNVEFLLQVQAGELGLDPGEVVRIIHRWLDGGAELLASRASHAKATGHPEAAYSAARLLWQNARRDA